MKYYITAMKIIAVQYTIDNLSLDTSFDAHF
jgi:hypothetical protein